VLPANKDRLSEANVATLVCNVVDADMPVKAITAPVPLLPGAIPLDV